MTPLITGIHHVTAFAKDPTANHAFYTRVLGLRMVKKTVNFDDPLTYHLYFGDEQGSPGTLLTHFPNPHMKRGHHGAPEIDRTTLGVPAGSLSAWAARLEGERVAFERRDAHDTEQIDLEDPDGMRISLVEQPNSRRPPEPSVVGIERVTIHVRSPDESRGFLERTLGFTATDASPDASRVRFALGGSGELLELIASDAFDDSVMGAGTVHHVAWRVPDDETQAELRERLGAARVSVTPVLDRQYFRSIYFRIPGGVVFEVATDGPGFDVDEPRESLGAELKLPPQHEPRRAEIESHLVPLSAT